MYTKTLATLVDDVEVDRKLQKVASLQVVADVFYFRFVCQLDGLFVAKHVAGLHGDSELHYNYNGSKSLPLA